MASDLENALDGFKDSDIMFDAKVATRAIDKQCEWLRKALLEAFESGWNARGDSDSDNARPLFTFPQIDATGKCMICQQQTDHGGLPCPKLTSTCADLPSSGAAKL